MGRITPFRGRRGPWKPRKPPLIDYRTARLLSTGAAIGAMLMGVGLGYAPTRPVSPVNDTATAACNIKGNISVSTGARIYHVPGQRYYDETTISPIRGERWFCSEVEAQAAGWRRSRK